MNNAIYEDAFNLLCGDLIGEGIHRKVFKCKLREDLVVKVEFDTNYRYFANVLEMKFWNDNEYYEKISNWLAPCEYLSPDGRILLQKRVAPILDANIMPKMVPTFLSDLKIDNFGLMGGRVVCIDYSMTIPNPSIKLKSVEW